MHLKSNLRGAFVRKPRLQNCPKVRVMKNLAKTPKSAISWNSSKGGPRENGWKSRPKLGAPKSPHRKSDYLQVSMRFKSNLRRAIWRKPRFQKCPQVRVMINLAKTPKSAIFLKFFKGGTKGKWLKKKADFRGSKITSAQIRLSPS